jgi:hypothetical protein
MSGRRLGLGLLGGLACFALGLGAARLTGTAAPGPSPAAPRIVFDPDTLQLLPDASLHLDLPAEIDFDAGAWSTRPRP